MQLVRAKNESTSIVSSLGEVHSVAFLARAQNHTLLYAHYQDSTQNGLAMTVQEQIKSC